MSYGSIPKPAILSLGKGAKHDSKRQRGLVIEDKAESDSELPIEEKVKLLQNWLDDIKLRQIAEENRPPEETRYYLPDVEALLHKYQIERLG